MNGLEGAVTGEVRTGENQGQWLVQMDRDPTCKEHHWFKPENLQLLQVLFR